MQKGARAEENKQHFVEKTKIIKTNFPPRLFILYLK